MSKITFRADDELIEELEEFDQSKSEVMRQALREYLDDHPEASVNDVDATDATGQPIDATEDTIDEFLAERVDRLIERRMDHHRGGHRPKAGPQDVNVTISLEGDSAADVETAADRRETGEGGQSDRGEDRESDRGEDRESDRGEDRDCITCAQCGTNVNADNVYCPNCGEKVTRRVFCECGDEIRSDWAFCPGCGRRTPAADVLDSS